MSSEEVSEQEESYSYGYSSSTTQLFSGRNADREAAFFLPHVKPGISLLDCGCGPGSITIDLAQAVAPGPVIGIDIGEDQLKGARKLAEDRAVSSIEFQAVSVYELPFPDEHFDAIFAHALLDHLAEPARAIHEMGRVLKSRGVIGLRDGDWGGRVSWPEYPAIDKYHEIQERGVSHTGGDLRIGRKLRRLLNQSGCFSHVETSASCIYYPQPGQSCRERADVWIERLWNSPLFSQAAELGWISRPEMEEMEVAFKEWGAHPEAFYANGRVEAVAWKQ